ncbi:MAG: class I SAM-dependent methyltransferase [Lutibacter sp.]|nr:class I SAM-dependent methyltransferase [Lutibacter sp.]
MINKKYCTHQREPFFDIVTKYINFDSIVLDVGCGNGDFAEFHKRFDFYMFDGNIQTVKHLKTKFSKVYQGILPVLPFESETFDIIHCSHVVEHLEPELLYNSLKEMDRCLKKGGHLVISAPFLWDGFYDDLSHVKPYPPNVFKNYLASKSSAPRTKAKISINYIVVEEIYRYMVHKPFEEIGRSKNNIFVKVFFKGIQLVEKLGVIKYKKTGFTIVLKK